MKHYLKNCAKYASLMMYIFLGTTLLMSGAINGRGGCQRPDAGPPGEPGTPGKDGNCTGLCVNGTDGRNGTDGTNGSCTGLCVNGTDGRNGTDGTNGSCTGLCVNGTDGRNGTDGTNGSCTGLCVNGTDGRNGTDGTNGSCTGLCVNGTNGKDGINGTNCNCSAVSLSAFGDWVRMEGEADVTLNAVAFPGPYQRVPFNTPDVPAVGITALQNTGPGSKGTEFTLANTGTYMVYVGIVTKSGSGLLFKLIKSPFDIPLGKGYLGSISNNTVAPVAIMFNATAGDKVWVGYVDTTPSVTIGGSSAGPMTSFVIIQIAS